MSRTISYNTGDKTEVLSYLGAAGRFTPEQQRDLGLIREQAQASQTRLEAQDIELGLSVPDALDHLIAGHASSDAEGAASAYYEAVQSIIDCTGSDSYELAVYSQPATFFGLMDDDLRRLGVPSDLLPRRYLFAGLPAAEISFRIPCPVDGPDIGMLALDKAKPAADAYRAVLDRVAEDFTWDLLVLIGRLDDEHDEWTYARKELDRYPDTIFFSISG